MKLQRSRPGAGGPLGEWVEFRDSVLSSSALDLGAWSLRGLEHEYCFNDRREPFDRPTTLAGNEHAADKALDALFSRAGDTAPRPPAFGYAKLQVSVFRNAARIEKLPWREPHVSLDGEAVILEWWCGAKKLTVYVQERSAEYVKVWGANIQDEMEEGELTEYLSLWTWLTAP